MRFAVRLAVCVLVAGSAAQSWGQAFPNKPLRILTAEPGGGLDFAARVISTPLSSALGTPIVVTNHGAGSFAAEIVAKAPPDGYSVLLYGSNVWLSPFLRDDVPWDPIKSFSPVTLATRGPNLVVVHPALPVRSIKELIALAKARPGALNYASGSSGSSPHLAAELFKAQARVEIVRISYRGNALGYADVLRGEVPLIFPTAASVAPHLKSGRLRALAVTTKQRSRLFPELPTVAESGLPDYEAATLVGVFVPARTPAAVIARLNREFANVLNQPEVQARFEASGVETVASTSDEFAETVKSEMARLGSMIKAAGIRDE
ncbi:MAG: Bug family tripartite tricarboxylate transporter substrate binding protein [Burkholderiales bacterium]